MRYKWASSQSHHCSPRSHRWKAIRIRGVRVKALKHPAHRTLSYVLLKKKTTSASQTAGYSDLSLSFLLCLCVSLSQSAPHQTNTNTPILITAVLIVQDGEAIAFFPCIFLHPSALLVLGLHQDNTHLSHSVFTQAIQVKWLTERNDRQPLSFIQRKLDSSATP